jgi:hypothetical protein
VILQILSTTRPPKYQKTPNASWEKLQILSSSVSPTDVWRISSNNFDVFRVGVLKPTTVIGMKMGLDIREFRRSRLLRVIAMLFLLHSAADMLFPQLCSEEELFGASFNSASTATNDRDLRETFAVHRLNESPGDQNPDQQHREEDCFCCCAHVMPSPVFANPAADLPLSRSVARRVFLPSAPSDNPYHPPRLA